MATTVTRDFPLLLCRIGFVLALAGVAAVWWRLSADDRFYAIIIAVAGSFALGLATSFHAFCSTLAVFGWVTIGFALFTLATGYSIGWRTVRVVENASGVTPLIFGLLLVVIAISAKRLVRRT
jgi:hypothetical protein